MPAHPLLLQGLALHRAGRLAEAAALYEQVPDSHPGHAEALHMRGLVAAQSGDPRLALELFDKAISADPQRAEAYSDRGNLLSDLGRLPEALASFDRAIALKPGYAPPYSNRGIVQRALQRPDEAIASYDQAIALRPDYFEAYSNRGVALLDLKRPAEALVSCERAIALRPDFADAHNNRGNALQELGRPGEALASYDAAIALQPGHAGAHANRGIALGELGRWNEALTAYDRALALNPGFAEAWADRGIALMELERLDEAVASYDRAIAIRPRYAAAHSNRGIALRKLARPGEALASYDRAIALNAGHAAAHANRGIVLKELQRPREALASCDKAIALQPDFAKAWSARGNALLDLGQAAEALASFDRALAPETARAKVRDGPADQASAPGYCGIALHDLRRQDDAIADDKPPAATDAASLCNNRGIALKALGRTAEAIASFEEAIARRPGFAEAYGNRGHALLELGRLDEAVGSYESALRFRADCDFLPGTMLHVKMQLCDWNGFAGNLAALEESVARGEKVTLPFPTLGLFDSPLLQQKAAAIYAGQLPRRANLGEIGRRPARRKIRVGYYSADFQSHATSLLAARLFELHDRSRFETYAFSFGPDPQDPMQDPMRTRLQAAFTRFILAREMESEEIARLSRELEIDIAVDLKGYTQDQRPEIFSCRCAPIQVSYLGYPGTTACADLDYIVADRTVIPEEAKPSYTEKVVYLPHSYQANDPTRPIADHAFTKRELGLPDSGFVFCCFNATYKIHPATFAVWMRILRAVPGSVLWLLECNPTAARNLRASAEDAGVDGKRLVFARIIASPLHLARVRLADLFLDTLPCNAHTTASDALWAGVPVLTRTGKSFASRVAASLLKAVWLPELITEDDEAYAASAIGLAANRAMLDQVRRKLAANRQNAPLFDAPLFTRHLEMAYEAMQARHLAGLAPDHIEVRG